MYIDIVELATKTKKSPRDILEAIAKELIEQAYQEGYGDGAHDAMLREEDFDVRFKYAVD